MKAKIGIVGAAGTLGSCAAFAIATQGISGELWLFDVNQNLLQSHTIDLQTAASVLGEMTVHAGQTDQDLSGCDVVLVTAGARWKQVSARMELLNDNLPIVRGIAETAGRRCPGAVVITATNPVDPLNYAFHLVSGMARSRLLGYTINDTYRFRMITAQALETTASRVEGVVVGEHGEHQVPLFSTLKLEGEPLLVTPGLRKQVLDGIPEALRAFESLGTARTSGWTSAVGLADTVRAVVQDTGEVFPCSVILDGEYGRKGFSACLPARLGRSGVLEIRQLDLPDDERAALESAFDFLQDTARTLRGALGSTGRG
jgi:malate dehydrogenase